ncbi:MAG: DUF1194 domain-containing protein [Pseudomonadota bacterium]
MARLPILAALLLGALPLRAEACALALLFALDVSASVDMDEYRQQRDGLAAALLSPAVREAVLAQEGGVAFAAYEWSGRHQQDLALPWTMVTAEPALLEVAQTLARGPRSYAEFPTAIGYALAYGSGLLREAPPCRRQVIDISGDGVGNEGFGPAAAYREFPFDGVTVNGLVIGGNDAELLSYYETHIPLGPEAFIEVAEDFSDYEDAMRRKLLRELYGPQVADGP